MSKTKAIKFNVSSADWVMNIEVDPEIFDDTYVEACTRAIEIKSKSIHMNEQDFLVNPVIMCRPTKSNHGKSKYINTYKVLLNAGMPKRAELLRKIFESTTQVDLAKEPLSASLKNEQ
jgi:hypothetical protein